jgi:nucleoid-associated protein YgaU
VDLDLGTGNRGYLVGQAPAPGEQKTTRQIIDATVEVPSLYKPKRSATTASLDIEAAPPELDLEAAGESLPAAAYDRYVVQKGDSLWSIAAKPEIYGRASRWRAIYDANRDLLKEPGDLRPGMTLRIPRAEAGGSSAEEGTDFKK